LFLYSTQFLADQESYLQLTKELNKQD
jgi:hypothetical protein